MITRRALLKGIVTVPLAGLSLSSAGLTGAGARAAPLSTRGLWLHRVRTGEKAWIVYYHRNQIVPDGYRRVCYLLRDVQADKAVSMDIDLLHLLFGMQGWLYTHGIKQPLRITSGYRTPETNAGIEGAARHSMHLKGQAADISMEGVPANYLAKLAKFFRAGGVGVYPERGFVHVDTGRIREWAG